MGRVIDPSQPLPVYVQLKTLLIEEILGGRYGPGDRLPTEHELCALYGISRTPVHRALAELAEEGAILRQRRLGTFVNPHWVRLNDSQAELLVTVPDGPWEALVRAACPDGVTLNVATVELDDLHQVLTHAVAEGRAPDVALLDSVWVPEFAAAGFLYPLDELDPGWLRKEYVADLVDPFVDANRFGGHPVALQAEADVAGLWYRRSLLVEVGLEPPRTWGDLTDAAAALTRAGVRRPLAFPAGSRGGEATTYCLLGLLAANGVTVLDEHGVTIDSPGAVECLTFLRDLVDGGVLAADAVSYEYDRAARMLARGQVALSIGGSYELRTLAAETGLGVDQVWEQFGFVPPPQGPRGGATTLAGGMVHGIFRQAQHPHLAMRLLQRLAAPEAMVRMARQTGQLAVRRTAAALADDGSGFLHDTAAMLGGAVVRPPTPTYPRVSNQLQAMLEAVLVGRTDPADAAHRAADLIAAITGLPVQVAVR